MAVETAALSPPAACVVCIVDEACVSSIVVVVMVAVVVAGRESTWLGGAARWSRRAMTQQTKEEREGKGYYLEIELYKGEEELIWDKPREE